MERDERFRVILGLVKDKNVLDVGCIDYMAKMQYTDDWLHKKIGTQAKSVIGLDVAEEEVKKLKKSYNIICGDAQTISLEKQFDCIVVGELIEHLENPGLFLKNMLKHLNPGGNIIITTPNPFYPKRIIEILFLKKQDVNPQHTCWYCDITLSQLLNRIGFKKIEVHYTNSSKALGGIGRLPSKLFRKRFSTHILVVGYKPS